MLELCHDGTKPPKSTLRKLNLPEQWAEYPVHQEPPGKAGYVYPDPQIEPDAGPHEMLADGVVSTEKEAVQYKISILAGPTVHE